MASTQLKYERASSPVDLVERLAAAQDWPFERATSDELTMTVAGTWTDYHVSVNWREDLEALHVAAAFDCKAPDARLNEIYRLIAQINEQLWVGHFDLWLHEGLLMYRHGLLLNGAIATPRQCEALIHSALEACERYYQSFQFVLWAGKSPEDALLATMLETQGQA